MRVVVVGGGKIGKADEMLSYEKNDVVLLRRKTKIREKDLTAVCIPVKGKRKLERLFGG